MAIDPSDPAASLSHDLQRRGIGEVADSDSEAEDGGQSDSEDDDSASSGSDSESYGGTLEVDRPRQRNRGSKQAGRDEGDADEEAGAEEEVPDQQGAAPSTSRFDQPVAKLVEQRNGDIDGVEPINEDEESSDEEDEEDAAEEEP